MSRHWHRVSKPIQTLAVALYPIMSEGICLLTKYIMSWRLTRKFNDSTS
jgi:hypothetical protein